MLNSSSPKVALSSSERFLDTKRCNPLKHITKGKKASCKIYTMYATFVATASGLFFAIVFGKISPKINRVTVMIKVEAKLTHSSAIPSLIKKPTDTVDSAVLTILFPIKRVVTVLSKSSDNCNAFFAPLFLSSTKLFNFTTFALENAVSDMEKNAERKMHTTMIIKINVSNDKPFVAALLKKTDCMSKSLHS